jgi:hypothetical protein
MAWKPTLRPGVDLRSLPLSPMQGFVASRIDGATDLHGLAQVTNLSDAQVEILLGELAELGAVDAPAAAAPEPAHAPAAVASEPPVDELPLIEPEPEDAGAEQEAEGEEEPEAQQQTHRALYASTLRELSPGDREARARVATEPELSAFCFDPLPAVIKALLENPHTGLAQGRLIAAHHQGQGLDAVTARAAFAADAGVRRALLRNPQLNAGLYRRLWGNRRLLEQYKVAVSREITEQTRRTARETMRQHFATAAPDERVELILKTDGRCLQMLIGLPIDSKTTSLLCAKTYSSLQLVQNLARWAPAPPALVAHLLRQDLVRRSPTLRLLLERHPNAPHGHGPHGAHGH